MTHDDRPPLELFHTRHGKVKSPVAELVWALEINEPVALPEDESIQGALSQLVRYHAKRRGIRIAMRTYESRLWVCRLEDEG